ncbi:hypothetical protein [Streptomyces humi]|uniref:hypothetical protein n=1 Tax=Streptomyces humi TaxID=1428620 RepID=UPI0006288525|nr:hypothetical protein [Streptomyces humi]
MGSLVGLCLAGSLTACGGGSGGGYTAVGAAGGPQETSARPTGSVTLVPLDGPKGTAGGPTASTHGPAGTTTGGAASAADGTGDSANSTDGTGGSADGTGNSASGTAPSAPSRSGTGTGRPQPSGPAASNSARPSAPSAAALTWSAPTREATDRRWCEKVTVSFRNSGGTAVRSGTVTLGTHIIDLLGIDWSTITATRPLPTPIGPDSRTDKTWTVCVDDWRVPLGMHIETRVETVDWS